MHALIRGSVVVEVVLANVSLIRFLHTTPTAASVQAFKAFCDSSCNSMDYNSDVNPRCYLLCAVASLYVVARHREYIKKPWVFSYHSSRRDEGGNRSDGQLVTLAKFGLDSPKT